jgi:Flp pilus assembly protein TadD
MASACLPAKARSLNHATELFQNGQYKDAAAEYRRASALDPSWEAPRIGLGNALHALGDRAGALAAYRAAVELAPNSPDAQVALAGLLLEGERWAECERQLQTAVKQLPHDGRLYAMLGYALAKDGHQQEALRAFERTQELCDRCMTPDETTVYAALKSAMK